MNTFAKNFTVTIIVTLNLLTFLSFSHFEIAQDKSVVKPVEIKMQHVGGVRAKFIVALISDGEGGAWIGSEDNTRIASEYYYDLAGNTIAQIIVPFDGKTLKPIADKKRVTRMEYDAGNRLTKIIQPNGATTLQEYDQLSNLIKKIDPLGNETKFLYDNLSRKTSEMNAEGGVTAYKYDSVGRMTALTDPVNNTTYWDYNLLGRVSSEVVVINKKPHHRRFYYDSAGNVLQKIDRSKRITEWTYDGLNRHTSEIWYENPMSWVQKTPSKKFATTYNSRGKLESINDGGNNFVFSYGIFGNKIKEAQTLTDFGKPIEFNFVTDINGLNTEKILKVDGKIDHANKYEVDTINRISTISQTVNNTSRNVNIQYDAFGQLSQQTRLDSGKQIIVTKNKFDDSGRLINISHTGNNKTYADYDITWDQANRITDFDFTYLNGPAKKSESKYLYDKTSQLINASYNFMPNEKYDFDLNGNRKKAEIQGKNQQYETSEYNRLLSDENYRYEYDLEGNRITKTNKTNNETTKYFWDNRNRLIKVETPTDTIEYLYDYQNRLVKRTENITNQQYFIHDDWQIILQYDNKQQAPTHRYLWGTKQDELLCDNENWTLGDHLNTIRDIVKSDGNVATHLDYNSFGKLISETKNDLPFFAYTGKLFDQISELQWNINRWYDSNVGRWMSEDPIGFEGNVVNVYQYVRNVPLSLIDIFGLRWTTERIYGDPEGKSESDGWGYAKLEISTRDKRGSYSHIATYHEYTVSSEAYAEFNGWTTFYKRTSTRTVTVRCNSTTGEISVNGCPLQDEVHHDYLSVRTDTNCVVDKDAKSAKIYVAAASVYLVSPTSYSINVTIVGTGGGFSFDLPASRSQVSRSWEWEYKCECTH